MATKSNALPLAASLGIRDVGTPRGEHVQHTAIAYTCTCGARFQLPWLHMCSSCVVLRCPKCVAREIDTYYCSGCLDIAPSPEVQTNKNRCTKCFVCPVCTSTLTTIASADRQFFMACGYCQWNSVELGLIADKIEGIRRSQLDQDQVDRFAALSAQFQTLATKDRAELERAEKHNRYRKHLLPLTTRALVGGASPMKGIGSPFTSSTALFGSGLGLGSLSIDAVELLAPAQRNALSRPANLSLAALLKDTTLDPAQYWFSGENGQGSVADVTTLKQRYTKPDVQPELLSALYPDRRQLSVKTRKLCPQCNSQIVKPDISTSASKFKIDIMAISYLPRLSIVSITPALRRPGFVDPQAEPAADGSAPAPVDGKSSLVLRITNPLDHDVTVTLTLDELVPASSLGIELPSRPLVLGAFHEVPLDDDDPDKPRYNDDPDIVVARKDNSLCVLVRLTMPSGVDLSEAIFTPPLIPAGSATSNAIAFPVSIYLGPELF
ncbi:hypothetical protein CAOG_000787 [Capsaspora owczarzaki ATCC 30864]|uniref:Dynactin subunit 4 n=1 Tax=Capsaspora owczarzaki (strain ATCC 30864) TaxID=595528 RepID=A0A0D2U234_CAPO3|nr:hypothetical protein CAOG_000787 [Capsaspora owczarzaki ATCC 30864]